MPPTVHWWLAGSPQAGKPVPTNSCGVQVCSWSACDASTLGVPTWMSTAILSFSISSVTSGGVLFGS